MTARWTCEQGHGWDTDPPVGASPRCPVCGAGLRAPEVLVDLLELLPTILTTMGDGLVVADCAGNFLYFNPAAERIVGRGRDAVPIDQWGTHFGIFHADTLEPVATDDLPLVRAIRGLDTNQIELLYRNEKIPEGVYAGVTGRPLRDATGTLRGGFIVLRDITAQKQAVHALRASEALFRKLFDASPDAIFVESFDGVVLDANPAACLLQGMPRAELIGKTIRDLTPPAQHERVLKGFAAMVRGERTQVEGYSWTRDGGALPVELRASHIEYGGQPALLLHVRDLTARIQAQEDLARSEERFQLAVLGSKDGIWDWDITHNQVYYSPRWKNMLGYTDDEIEPRYEEWYNRLHPEDRERSVQTLQAYLAGELPEYELEHRLRHKDGSYRWILARGVAFHDRNGRPSRMAGSHTDIHARKEAEEALRAAQRAAEAANRAKSQFLATVSHELRTPLAGIHGLTELLLEAGPTESQRDYLQMLRTCNSSLLGLINDILDFSRADAGSLVLHPQPFDLRAEVGATLKSMGIQAAQKGLLFAYRIDPDVPGQWHADWPRLRQVLINLLGNAFKFTHAGSVTLRVGTAISLPEDEGRLRVVFEVRDTGIGVPEDKQQVIFEPFVQADGSLTRKYGGTGLGLSIAQRLVELMGGHIELESVVGQGSTFRFDIPVEVTGPRSRLVPASLRDRVILVLEPNALHRGLLSEALEEADMKAQVAPTLAAASELSARGAVDVVLVAVEGFAERWGELVEWLRKLPTARVLQLVPVGTRVPGLPAHITCASISLPLVFEELTEQLERLLQGAPRRAALTLPRFTSPQRKLRVLVAEDTPLNQTFICRLLEKQGHDVVVVDNGRAAVERVRQEQFDAVLMDVSMPEMDGLQATALIRVEQGDTPRRLPIIALTAHALPSDREACLRAGMDAYVPKPVDPKLLTNLLNELTAAPADVSVPVPPSAVETTS
jgi:PAS domain S-box-containing protein